MSAWPATIGLVGCGAMGRALAAGVVRSRPDLAAALRLSDAVGAATAAAAKDTGGTPATVAEAAACDLVVLAVKPKDVDAALAEARPAMSAETVLMSVAAGWTLDRLAGAAPGVPLVRTMPNLAVRHGAGLTVVAVRDVAPEREEALVRLLEGTGAVVPLDEALFGAATGLAGCGPGFLALVAEALEEGGVATGLSRPQARAIVRALLTGTGALLADGTDPADLRQRVSSPGGATIAGIGVLERGAVRAHLADAVRAAAARAAEL